MGRTRMTAEQTQRLMRRAVSADFMELVYELERHLGAGAAIGGAGPAGAEPVRFRHDPSLAFPSSDISEASLSEGDEVELTTTFLGVTGAASPLPAYLAEEVLQEDPDAPLMRDFLDMFHHRLLGLLYRGVSSLRYPQAFLTGGRDPLSLRLFCLCGFDLFDSVCESPVSRSLLLRLSPLLLTHGPTTEALTVALRIALEGIIGDAEVSVRTFTGGRIPVADVDRMRLGVNTVLGARNAPPLGDSVVCASAAIEVHIGPISLEGYRQLRSEEQLSQLREVIALVSCQALDCGLVLTLKQGATPPWRLASAAPAQLGVDSWLMSAAGTRTSDVRIRLPA